MTAIRLQCEIKGLFAFGFCRMPRAMTPQKPPKVRLGWGYLLSC